MQPSLQGMLPVIDGKFAALQSSAVHWPNSLRQCAAVCNSLNLVSKQKVVGDAADFAAFQACEAMFLVGHCAIQSVFYAELLLHGVAFCNGGTGPLVCITAAMVFVT